MYRESETIKQIDMLNDPRLEMGKRTKEIFESDQGWHNRFRQEVTNRVDESIFKPLFNEKYGAPNAPIRVLVAMMAYKEGLGISDEQLYEQARFNTLTRSALGLHNSDEEVPTESTYYLFRWRITDYAERRGKNLLEEAFAQITKEQCQEYHVSGKRIRMDSKLLGSNIAWYSRYGIVHETIRTYCTANGIVTLAGKDAELAAVLKEKATSVTYRNTKEEVERLLEGLGSLMYGLLQAVGAEGSHKYSLLQRVFDEQYEVVSGPGGGKKKRVQAREKTEISAQSVQNPHDTDSEYRKKGNKQVKGYSINVTETCDKDQLNLIVDVQVEGCSTADVDYLQKGLENAQELVVDTIEEAFTDGAYHSPENQDYCEEHTIDLVLGGIQGKSSKYDVSYDEDGNLVVINTETGEELEVKKVNRRDPDAPELWSAKEGDKSPRYFGDKDVKTCELRKRIESTPKERLDVRNNVEATIFQLGYHCDGDKSRYRGLLPHRLWALSRCLWVNFRRIQLWQLRTAAGKGSDCSDASNVGFVFNYLQKFFHKYQSFFYSPVLPGCY